MTHVSPRTRHFYYRGFTLVELLITIAILAVISTLIFVAIHPVRRLQDARRARAQVSAESIAKGLNVRGAEGELLAIDAYLKATGGTALAYGCEGTDGCIGDWFPAAAGPPPDSASPGCESMQLNAENFPLRDGCIDVMQDLDLSSAPVTDEFGIAVRFNGITYETTILSLEPAQTAFDPGIGEELDEIDGGSEVYFVGSEEKGTSAGILEDRIFPTIAEAQSAVRTAIASGMTEDVTILLDSGDYYDARIDFTAADSGRDGHRVVWRNFPGETPRLVGGVLADSLSGDAWTIAGTNVYKKNIGAGRDINVVFENGEFLLNARYPNGDFMFMDKYPNGGAGKFWNYAKNIQPVGCNSGGSIWRSFCYADADFNEVPEFLACMTSPSPPPTCGSRVDTKVYLWVNAWSAIVSKFTMDPIAKRVDLARDLQYPLNDTELHDGHSRYAYHAIGHRTLLDAPGEFFYDRETGDLFVYPRSGSVSDIVVPTRRGIVSLRGTLASPVRDIVLKGLEFTATNFVNEHIGVHSAPGQRLETMYPDTAYSAIEIVNGQNILIEGNHIHHAGTNAISIAGASQKNIVYDNLIEKTGVTAVYLNGDYVLSDGTSLLGVVNPSVATHIANGYVQRNNTIANNRILESSLLMNAANAIAIVASGENVIAHNDIRGMGGGAFRLVGHTVNTLKMRGVSVPTNAEPDPFVINFAKGNIFAYNDISKFMRFTADDGALYAHHSGINNVIYHNDFHDTDVRDYDLDYMGSTSMNVIYLDQTASYFQIVKNIFRDLNIVNSAGGGGPCDSADKANSGCGVPIIADGEFNLIDNNIFDQTADIFAWGVQSTGGNYEGIGQFSVLRNVIFNSHARARFIHASAFIPYVNTATSWNASQSLPVPDPMPFQGFNASNNIYYQPNSTESVKYTVRGSSTVTHPNFQPFPLTLNPGWNDIRFSDWVSAGFEQGSLTGTDPLFVNRAGGDYRYQAGSPASGLGIEPIDRTRIGVFAEEHSGIVPVSPLPLYTNQSSLSVDYFLADDETREIRTAVFSLAPGKQTKNITAVNAAGQNVSYAFEVTLDTTPPVLLVTSPGSPPPNIPLGSRNYLYAKLQVDGQREFWKEFRYFSNGTYTIPYRVYDYAGNPSNLLPFTFSRP